MHIDKTSISSRLSKFKHLSSIMLPFFKLENIELNFKGYEQMLYEYATFDAHNHDSAFNVVRDLMLWIDYISGLSGVVSSCILKLENRQKYIEAFIEEKENKTLLKMIVETKNNQDLCRYYLKELNSQIKFLTISYKYAVSEYNDFINR